MSKPAASRIAGEEAVPLRGALSAEEEPLTAVVEEATEDPVPLRRGPERVASEERAERLRILTGRRPRWR